MFVPVPETSLPDLSVVIPAYNEATRLPPSLENVMDYLRARAEPMS